MDRKWLELIAQDLLIRRPDAVATSDSGYMMVDYDQIDVKMTTFQAYMGSCRSHIEGKKASSPCLLAINR